MIQTSFKKEPYFEVFGFGLVMIDSFDPRADMHIADVNQRESDRIRIIASHFTNCEVNLPTAN